jgi:hypothetical protein
LIDLRIQLLNQKSEIQVKLAVLGYLYESAKNDPEMRLKATEALEKAARFRLFASRDDRVVINTAKNWLDRLKED